MSKRVRLRQLARAVLTLAFVGVGTLHFVSPAFFVAIMPPYLPWHLPLVYLSGVCEIAGGVAIQIPRLRRAAGWGLVALLVAVFPANVHMAMDPAPEVDVGIWAWVRLPFQLVFIAWVLWVMRDEGESTTGHPSATRSG